VAVEAKPSPLNTLAARYPSYEGNSYGSLPTLREMKSQEKVRSSRIPSPVEIPPSGITRGYHPIVEKAVARAVTTPIATEPAPPIPVKSIRRYGSIHGHVRGPPSEISSVASDSRTLGDRIISKENIRAVVGSLSRENSGESLKEKGSLGVSYTEAHAFARIGGRGMNTGELSQLSGLPTFNTHMFPREGRQTPVGSTRKKYADIHEMEVLKGNGRTH
jgi:hypothetical protein